MTLIEAIGGKLITYAAHQTCSCCGVWIAYYENEFKYCPYCGAEMIEGVRANES